MDACGGMTARCRRGDDGLTVEISLVDGRVVTVLSSRRCCGESGEEKKGRESRGNSSMRAFSVAERGGQWTGFVSRLKYL